MDWMDGVRYHRQKTLRRRSVSVKVDSYRWLPRSLAVWLRESWHVPEETSSTPFTPLSVPLRETRFALLTTGGLYLKDRQEPFDLARERREPEWGDPTYRIIPRDVELGDIAVAHLHYNPEDIEADFNVLLPIHRFKELEAAGEIGGLAPSSYSVMGYQGHPGPGWGPWQERYGPEMLARMTSEGVDAVLLTPA
jgi:D-proline reductase (dithiol) PrdB